MYLLINNPYDLNNPYAHESKNTNLETVSVRDLDSSFQVKKIYTLSANCPLQYTIYEHI